MNFNDIRITEEEAKTFEDLVEKREALENLVFIIDNNPIAYNDEIYQRFIKDYENTLNGIDKEWDKIIEKYNIGELKEKLYLDFATNEIKLSTSN